MLQKYSKLIKILVVLMWLQFSTTQEHYQEYDYSDTSGDGDLKVASRIKTSRNISFEEKFNIIEKKIDLLISANREQQQRIEIMETTKKQEMPHRDACARHTKPYRVLEVKCSDEHLPENCYQINECHNHLYNIMIPNYNDQSFPVACDLKTEDGGWTIIQRRQDGSVNFYRNWTDYVEGFGDLNGEFFIGLEKLHALTTLDGPQELYIKLEDFEGQRRYALYKTFEVGSNDTDYLLNVGQYQGNTGDSFRQHNGHKFSTLDRDNGGNCAVKYKGAWWFRACHNSHLNGEYLMGKMPLSKRGHGIIWNNFRGNDYSLKFVQMMIRPKQD